MSGILHCIVEAVLPIVGAGVIALLIVDRGTRGIDYEAEATP